MRTRPPNGGETMKKILLLVAIAAAVWLGYFAFDALTSPKIDLKTADFYVKEKELPVVRVRKGDKWALATSRGYLLSGFEYDTLYQFYEGKSVTIANKKYGVIDAKAKVVVSPKYDIIMGYMYGISLVSLNGKWGVIDETGNEIVKPTYYDYISSFDQSGRARAANYSENREVLLNRAGKVVKKIK
jgi:hypothetical protein